MTKPRNRKKTSPAAKALGATVRRMVNDTGLPVRTVAARIGMTPQDLWRYMTGQQLTRHAKFLDRLHQIEGMKAKGRRTA